MQFSWLAITVLCTILKSTSGGGYLKMKLISYENKYGYDRSKNYCDPKPFGGRTSECDLKMTLILDGRNSGIGPRWDKMKSHTFYDQDSVHHFPYFGMEHNPIRKTFNSWQGRLYVGLDVIDKDGLSGDDHVDSLARSYSVPSDGITRKHTINGYIHGHNSQFTFSLAVACDKHYYPPTCGKYCKPRDDGKGHYTCDSRGNKHCLKGWRNEVNDCKDVDNCLKMVCLNGGHCRENYRGARCTCPAGFHGPQCENEMKVNRCQNFSCLNGGNCRVVHGVTSCNCKSPYFGARCELCNHTAEGGDHCPIFTNSHLQPAPPVMMHQQEKKVIIIHPATYLVPLVVLFIIIVAFVLHRQWKSFRPFLPSFLQTKGSREGSVFDNTYYSATVGLSTPERDVAIIREVANNVYDLEDPPCSDSSSSHEEMDDGSLYGSLDDNNSVFEEPKDCPEDERFREGNQPRPPALPPRNPVPTVVSQGLTLDHTVCHV